MLLLKPLTDCFSHSLTLKKQVFNAVIGGYYDNSMVQVDVTSFSLSSACVLICPNLKVMAKNVCIHIINKYRLLVMVSIPPFVLVFQIWFFIVQLFDLSPSSMWFAWLWWAPVPNASYSVCRVCWCLINVILLDVVLQFLVIVDKFRVFIHNGRQAFLHHPLTQYLPVTFSGSGFLFDVHIVLQWLWIFFGTVVKCSPLVLYTATTNVRVIPLNVEVTSIRKLKLLCIPSTNVKMSVAILMSLLANASLKQLIRRRVRFILQVLHHDLFLNRALTVGEEDRLRRVSKPYLLVVPLFRHFP